MFPAAFSLYLTDVLKLVNASLVAGDEDVVYPHVAVARSVVIRQVRVTIILAVLPSRWLPVPTKSKIPCAPLLLATLLVKVLLLAPFIVKPC